MRTLGVLACVGVGFTIDATDNWQNTDSGIDISSLEKGVYYIIIKSENEITYSKSLVKI